MGQGHLQEAQGQGLDLIPSAGAAPGQEGQARRLAGSTVALPVPVRLWSRNHPHQCSMGVS